VSIASGDQLPLGGVTVVPLEFWHGTMTVYGYRFGPFAYLTDVKSVPEESRKALAGVRYLVVNALFDRPHPTHLSIPEAIELARDLGAEQTFLTHLTHRFTHEGMKAMLPPGIEPAYDGLVIEW
jgi:phosphoribosyl 1,2-cyclic phosphate phosphodiesterase